MVVPHELALHLYQLYLKVIQLAHNLWIEIILKGGKLLRKINYLHGYVPPAGLAIFYFCWIASARAWIHQEMASELWDRLEHAEE
jgi:hypothetical protein